MKLCPKCQKQFSDDANFCPVDAARLVPLQAQAEATDSLTSRFELGQRLGGARTGAVHRAVDKTTGKPCVVKLVAPAVVALPGVAQRLERELKQLERVQSAGVAHVIASGKRAGDETWVATELIEGAQTLAESIGARGPIPQEQAANLIEVIGEALIEAAQVGVVHRDLAPKNILFAGQDVKLINFSLPVPTSDKVPGVPEFVAPEQVDGRPVDQRSNLYSLGALYYYVLTGAPIFVGTADEVHRLHTSGTIKPPSQLAPVPAAVEAVILRALDRSPTKRFLTVRQFVDEVTRVGHAEVIELKTTLPNGKAGRPKGELVQTLMGISKGGAPIASAPTAAVPPVAAAPQPAPAAKPGIGAQTVLGMPSPSHQPAAPVGMAASVASPPVAINPLTPPAGVDPLPKQEASPWAPPAAAAPAPAAPVVPQAPVVTAPPVVAAPQVPAAPQVANAPAGKKKTVPEEAGGKGKFRETMWFKKGDLDAQAAVAAAEERARTGKDVSTDKADTLPIDERYKDDGSISRSDKEKYSLRTGATMMMSAVKDAPASQSMNKIGEDVLVSEMKGGRTWVFLAIAAGLVAIGLIIAMLAR
jgi:hypothetical protein